MATVPDIEDADRLVLFTATASQVDFSVTWPVFGTDNADAMTTLRVTVDGVEETDWTFVGIVISGLTDVFDGGTITRPTVLTGGEAIVIWSDGPAKRDSDFIEGAAFPATTQDLVLNRIFANQRDDQQRREAILRRPFDETTLDMKIPNVAARFGKFLGFGPTGLPVALGDTSIGSSILLSDLAATTGAGLIGFKNSGTGAVARTADDKFQESVNVIDFGANTTPGTTDMTTPIQNALDSGAKIVNLPEGILLFTTLTVPANVTFRGAGTDGTTAGTAGTYLKTITTGDALTIGGHNVHLEDFTLAQTSGTKQGKGLVSADKYWLTTNRISVKGFEYTHYVSKSLYHTYIDSRFEQGDYGMYFWGAAGAWNSDWFNNQNTIINCRADGDIISCYIQGVNFTVDLDVSGVSAGAAAIGLSLVGQSNSARTTGIKIANLYSENATLPLNMSFAEATLVSGYFQPASSPGAKPFALDESQLIVNGMIRGNDTWTNAAVLTNNSRYEAPRAMTKTTIGVFSTDATSEAYVIDYEEGTSTLTLTGCTTAPTILAKWVRSGKFVTVFLPAVEATGDGGGVHSLTGMDASLTPATIQRTLITAKNNGAHVNGSVRINASTTLTLYPGISGSSFEAAGVNGIAASVLHYSLY